MSGLVSQPKITIKKLEPNQSYLFRVRAENIYGHGEALVGQSFTAKDPYGKYQQTLSYICTSL